MARKPTEQEMLQEALRLHESGRLAEAEALYRKVLASHPYHDGLLHVLGLLAGQQGRTDASIDLIERAIAANPTVADYHNNLGESYRRAQQCERAIASFRRAVELKPDFAMAHNNLGTVLQKTNRLQEAIAAYRRAIEIEPNLAQAQCTLGYVLWLQDRQEEAIAACRRAIEINPFYAEAYTNLGVALLQTGRLSEAVACFRNATAYELNLDDTRAASNLLFALHYQADCDAQRLLAEHRDWARRYAEPLAAEIRRHDNDRSPARKLRVGYLSADFREHPVGHLLLPLFSHLDHRETEIVCYSHMQSADAVTTKLKALADGWHDILGRSDQQVAEQIRADRIDILVDLALHTEGNRLLVFARKPAPVQVTMLGMPSTSGLTTIDYRFTDPYLDPPGVSDADYTEESVRLPHCYWVFQPPEELPSVSALPAAKNGFVTFGCLNQFAKVTRPALQLWVKVLQSLPGSRLVLQASPGSHQGAARALFEEGGIAGERIEFAAGTSRLNYLRRFHGLDVGLDPFPYNGHTSTLDALWMGVPVITLAGRTAVARGGVSILSNVGLPELIAQTPKQYVDIAVGLARDWERLTKLRSGLRELMLSSPPADARKYASDVETAFRRMWERWCGTLGDCVAQRPPCIPPS